MLFTLYIYIYVILRLLIGRSRSFTNNAAIGFPENQVYFSDTVRSG